VKKTAMVYFRALLRHSRTSALTQNDGCAPPFWYIITVGKSNIHMITSSDTGKALFQI